MTASPVSVLRRAMSSARSLSVRKLAVSGQLVHQNFVITPATTVIVPSMIKIHLDIQISMGPWPLDEAPYLQPL